MSVAPESAWAIVGGGLHAVHVATVLVAASGVDPDRLVVVDPGAQLIDRWRHVVANTGMTHLRSPGVHHLDLDPWSLHRFAGAPAGKGRSPAFAAPYDRPAVGLFEAHAASLVARHGFDARHVRGRVRRLHPTADRVTVELEDGRTWGAERVVLATGMSDQPSFPDWAVAAAAAGQDVRHVLDPAFRLEPDRVASRVAVVGAGISGVQVALRLARGDRRVTLVTRHALREHPFDSDPGWLGPLHMAPFAADPDPVRRRARIAEARHRGSVPHDVKVKLAAAVREGRVELVLGHATGLEPRSRGLALRVGSRDLDVATVLLATGYETRRPGGALVDELVHRHRLRCAPCGYPIVDAHLRWHPRIHLVGPLAELELGPTARNIAGARRAGERLAAFLDVRAARRRVAA